MECRVIFSQSPGAFNIDDSYTVYDSESYYFKQMKLYAICIMCRPPVLVKTLTAFVCNALDHLRRDAEATDVQHWYQFPMEPPSSGESRMTMLMNTYRAVEQIQVDFSHVSSICVHLVHSKYIRVTVRGKIKYA